MPFFPWPIARWVMADTSTQFLFTDAFIHRNHRPELRNGEFAKAGAKRRVFLRRAFRWRGCGRRWGRLRGITLDRHPADGVPIAVPAGCRRPDDDRPKRRPLRGPAPPRKPRGLAVHVPSPFQPPDPPVKKKPGRSEQQPGPCIDQIRRRRLRQFFSIHLSFHLNSQQPGVNAFLPSTDDVA